MKQSLHISVTALLTFALLQHAAAQTNTAMVVVLY
jgi:hypothetical protein